MRGELPADAILRQLEAEIGKIMELEQICPGIYYLSAGGTEYYAVMQNAPAISQRAWLYGQQVSPELRLYPMDKPQSGWMVVRYEVCKYLIKNGLPLPDEDTLHSIATFGMECHPEYFGTFPVPALTPYGRTLRYRRMGNGIYWIETEQCTEVLAVCFPVWDGELSEATQKIAMQLDYDKQYGIENTLGYLFFSEDMSCVPIFELLKIRREWEVSGLIDNAALMNAIWENAPAYALAYNGMEQAGMNDIPGTIAESLGIAIAQTSRTEHMIRLTPGAGTAFLNKEQFPNE